MKGKYLYGIIKKPKDREKHGLSTVDFQSLSAVIADRQYKDYSSLSKDKVVKELTDHQKMIEKIMEGFAVLPVKFGTILKNEEQVQSVLEKKYFFLRDTLRKIEDKIELDLVCFWDEQKAAQMAYKEDKKIQKLQENLIKKRKTSLEDKIALGKLVAKYLASKKTKISSQIHQVLKNKAVESCSYALADVNMLLNCAFLVKKENKKNFHNVLNLLDSRFAGLVNFRLVGPLPSYSFATVVVEILDEEEVNSAKKLLSLNDQLSREKIKQAYNQLAKWFHPDKGGDPLLFQFAVKAYKLLTKYVEHHGLVGVCLHKWQDQQEL